MPRYFFDVHDGVSQIDQDGTELAGIVSARSEALVQAGEVIRDAGRRADLGEECCIEVRDDTGLILFRMDFVLAETAATGRKAAASHPG